MRKFSTEHVTINRIRSLSCDYYSMRLGPWSVASKCRPGQFVHVGLPDTDILFRRAFSVAVIHSETAELELIFKVFGRGTRLLTGYHKGDRLDILGPLGVPFEMPRKNETCLMIGGGVGFPPLFYLADWLIRKGRDPKTIEFFYGGRTSGEIVERNRFRNLGVKFRPVTDDGSFGDRGLVTEIVEDYLNTTSSSRLRIYSCGPEPMLRAVDAMGRNYGIPGQLSLEAPMPCGIGICLGCVVPLRNGEYARVCAEGPVFDIGEVLL